VAVKIRLLRMGKIRNPQYRIVVANSRTKRDGKAIEFIGIYQPKEDPSIIEVNSDRVQHWLSVGAQPSEPVQRLLEKTGDWQKFKGLPAPPPLLMAPARADRKALYEAEAQASAGLTPAPEAKPAKKAPAKAAKAAEPKAEAPAAPAAVPAETPAVVPAETPAAEPAEAPAAETVAAEAASTEAPAEPTAAAAEPTEGVTDAGATEQG
jgi:small subunit ribosomal protein S16